MRRLPPLVAIATMLSALATSGVAAVPPQRSFTSPVTSPSLLCRMATSEAEAALRIPDQLLSAIAKVESGRPDPSTGTLQPWPWTINVEGVGHFYESKAEAIAAVQQFQANGARSIDVGCMQVNLSYHPEAFASLDQAFDPASNANFAARFLQQLFTQQGSWPHAAAAYHSQSPGLGADYQRRVLEVWAQPDRPPGGPSRTTFANAGAGHPGRSDSVAPQPAMAQATPSLPSSPFGGGMMPLAGGAHVVRMAGGGGVLATGRGLDSYRLTPVASTSRFLHP